jgi:carboxyl-terminal processing protease
MNRENNLRTPLVFAGIMAIGMFLGYQMNNSMRTNVGHSGSGNGNLAEIMNLVNEKYVDSLNVDSLEMKTIDDLLTHLDPHSIYIKPDQLEAVNEDMDGEFDGIGVEYYIQQDTILITSVLANGPSAKAGILNGDKIIKVDDSIVAGVKINSKRITHLLRGSSNTKVELMVMRPGKIIKNISVTRGTIPMTSIDAAYMLLDKIGYIRINRFAATTANEFKTKLMELQRDGMKKLVIDLRDNGGGYLDACVSIADELLPGKKTILYTRGCKKNNETFKAESKGNFETGNLVVLVDEGSASAAEVLSGCLQDYDRATIIGRRTFGKGLVQEQYPLSNGGALRLTIARYYIPSGRCIQKDYSNGIENYEEDLMNRYHRGELVNKDSITFKDTTVYKTMGGKRVYGGGGIMPDIFIPLAASKYSDDLRDIANSKSLDEVINDYYINNTETLKKFSSVNDYDAHFEVNQKMIENLKSKCVVEKLNVAPFSKPNDIGYLKKRIKAQLAKSVFNSEAQYIILNSNDDFIKKAIETLNK